MINFVTQSIHNIIQHLIKLNHLYAVSRTQQGRQTEASVKTLHSPLSDEIWRHCVFSVGTQRRVLPRHQSEEISDESGSNPQLVDFAVTLCASAPQLASIIYLYIKKCNVEREK